MIWLIWAIPLLILVFLWRLNECLNGSLKEPTSGVLAICVFALCGVAVWISGWVAGLLALVGSFFVANLFHAPALALARQLRRYP